MSSLMSHFILLRVASPKYLTSYYVVLSISVNSREKFYQLPLTMITLLNINEQKSADRVSRAVIQGH